MADLSKWKYLMRLYLAVVYETLLMLALTLAVTAVTVWLVGDVSHGWSRLGLQCLLWWVMGGYFVRCWVRSGQTLACQTWKLKLTAADGRLLNRQQAVLRYLVAGLLLLPAGLTFWWAMLDPEQQCLHDRLLGSRLRALSAEHPHSAAA